MRTAFQVERAIYDDILLRRAQQLGCDVRQQTKVAKVERDGDRVTGLTLASGQTVTARWYVDASGHGGLLRRALDVPVTCPARLKNVAIWDYWDNVEWADTIGVGGTRVQVLSVGYGWIWFIPVSPSRASIGLICAASYYKESSPSTASPAWTTATRRTSASMSTSTRPVRARSCPPTGPTGAG